MFFAGKVPIEGFWIWVERDAGFESWGGGQTGLQGFNVLSAEGREGGGF